MYFVSGARGRRKPHLRSSWKKIFFVVVCAKRDIWHAIKKKGDKLRKIFTLTFFFLFHFFRLLISWKMYICTVFGTFVGCCLMMLRNWGIGWWGAKINEQRKNMRRSFYWGLWYLYRVILGLDGNYLKIWINKIYFWFKKWEKIFWVRNLTYE